MIPLSSTSASLGFAFGCALVIVGVFLAAGPAWALIAAGAVVAASFLLFTPVEESPSSDEEPAP